MVEGPPYTVDGALVVLNPILSLVKQQNNLFISFSPCAYYVYTPSTHRLLGCSYNPFGFINELTIKSISPFYYFRLQ